MEPQDDATRRYILDRKFPDGLWYLWIVGEDALPINKSLEECLEEIRRREGEV